MAWEPDYVTSDNFKHYARVSDSMDDLEISRAITSASRAIDRQCSVSRNGMGFRRQFGLADTLEDRYYTPRWDRRLAKWVIEIDDLMDITGLVVAFDLDRNDTYETTCTDYMLRPRDALANKRPYTQIAINNTSAVQPTLWPDSAKITLKAGWTSIPFTIENATYLQGHRFLKRRLSPMGVAGSTQTGSGSSEKRETYEVDPDVCQMLQPYQRLGWTV